MLQFVCAAVMVLSGASVWAAGADGQVQPVAAPKSTTTQVVKTPPTTKKAKKAQKKAAPKAAEPVQHAPSGESIPEREKRLLRECKGRPNAGACLGYAS